MDRAKLTVRDLRLMLAELDPNEKIGYSDGHGGCVAAVSAEFTADPHDPECDCGCVSIALI